MASKTVHPVETLQEYARSLEAAMSVALADPKKPAVHKLRALTRRLEAQVELLAQLKAVACDSAEAEELSQQLRKLRRATGRVRDLDVQRKILKTHPSLPVRAAAELRGDLKHARERKAAKLQKLLLKQLPRLVGAIEQLVQSVGTANGLAIPDLRLVPLIERWKRSQETPGLMEEKTDEQLHRVRKTAKTARYMTESMQGSSAAHEASARYEAEQDAGGHWHDWLDLAEAAQTYFGKKHPLTRAARKQCGVARAEYLKTLG